MPASVVVSIYSTFIVGGALPGVVVPAEPVTLTKAIGLTLAVIGTTLIAWSNPGRAIDDSGGVD